MHETELALKGVGFPRFSARGCVQTLSPLRVGRFYRTINSELIYVGKEADQKYRSTITCQDKTALALEGLWCGSEVEVECLQRLWQQVTLPSNGIKSLSIELNRPAVSSSLTFDRPLKGITLEQSSPQQVSLSVSHDWQGVEILFLSYRPCLKMRVVSFALLTDEWGMKAGWNLDLEEI